MDQGTSGRYYFLNNTKNNTCCKRALCNTRSLFECTLCQLHQGMIAHHTDMSEGPHTKQHANHILEEASNRRSSQEERLAALDLEWCSCILRAEGNACTPFQTNHNILHHKCTGKKSLCFLSMMCYQQSNGHMRALVVVSGNQCNNRWGKGIPEKHCHLIRARPRAA